jgi:hypothetical protein
MSAQKPQKSRAPPDLRCQLQQRARSALFNPTAHVFKEGLDASVIYTRRGWCGNGALGPNTTVFCAQIAFIGGACDRTHWRQVVALHADTLLRHSATNYGAHSAFVGEANRCRACGPTHLALCIRGVGSGQAGAFGRRTAICGPRVASRETTAGAAIVAAH